MDVVIKQIPERTVAYLKCRGSWKQIPGKIASLTDLLNGRSIEAEGPPSGIYYNIPGEVGIDDLEWEIFYPISAMYRFLPEDKFGFGIKKLLSVQVAATVFNGIYRKTGSTYAALNDWVLANDLTVCGPSQEEYPCGLIDAQADQIIEIRLPVCANV